MEQGEKLNTIKLLKKFFLNYLWSGVVLLLLSIILDLAYPSQSRCELTTIAIKLLEGIGIAVLVASIFSFASGTSTFIAKIRRLLESIVVSRSFLSNIDAEGKKEALKSLIQPTSSEKNKYPNIGDYYGRYVEKTLTVDRKSVRSNYAIHARACFDNEKQKVFVESVFNYRLYPSSNGFNDIVIGFNEQLDGDSWCKHIAVSDTSGKRKVWPGDSLDFKEFNDNGDITNKASVNIEEYSSYANHLDVEVSIVEYGLDHWQLIKFIALQPTDGFSFKLHCETVVTIKDHAIFMVGAPYYLNITTDRRDMTLSCNRWIDEGSGICVVVSAP